MSRLSRFRLISVTIVIATSRSDVGVVSRLRIGNSANAAKLTVEIHAACKGCVCVWVLILSLL